VKPLNANNLRVLAALRANRGGVTPRDFNHAPTIDGHDEMERLAARILELREHGYLITTVMETSFKNKRYARYTLVAEPDGDQLRLAA
jgi:hypothetical protein